MTIDDDLFLSAVTVIREQIMRRRKLELLLAHVGAVEGEDGEWFWPFYRPGEVPLMLSTEDWIAARRKEAQELGYLRERERREHMEGETPE